MMEEQKPKIPNFNELTVREIAEFITRIKLGNHKIKDIWLIGVGDGRIRLELEVENEN